MFSLFWTQPLVSHSLIGQAWICGPARGHSLARFVDCARAGGLGVERRDRFDERVWSMHCAYAEAAAEALSQASQTFSAFADAVPPLSDTTGAQHADSGQARETQQYVPDRHQPILLIVTLPSAER